MKAGHLIGASAMRRAVKLGPVAAVAVMLSGTPGWGQDTQRLFATPEETYTELFLRHIAALQRYLPAAMPLLAPNVNSYRRLRRYSDAPINLHWGWENRTVGLRVPDSTWVARRVENRVAGADANP